MYKIYSTKKIAAGRSRRQNGGYGTRDSQKKEQQSLFFGPDAKNRTFAVGNCKFFRIFK